MEDLSEDKEANVTEASELNEQTMEDHSEDNEANLTEASELNEQTIEAESEFRDRGDIQQQAAAVNDNDDDNDSDNNDSDDDYDFEGLEHGSRQWEDIAGLFNGTFSLQEAIKR